MTQQGIKSVYAPISVFICICQSAARNIALDAHELIKVKASQLEREDKQALASEICEQTQSDFVQNIGGVFVFYRKRKEEDQ